MALRWRRAALASNDFDRVDDDVHRLPADRRVSATTADPMRHSMRTTPRPIAIADTAAKRYNCAHHYSATAVAEDADVSTLQVRHCDGQASAYKARRGPPPGFL